jgi:CheY-like chemotaxis protein
MVIVDDDPKVRVLLERAFRAPEFEAHTFPTARAALEKVSELRPDCIVSDILMPDMDGERFLRAVRQLPGLEQVPFVACSAVRSEAKIRAVLDAGAAAFLLKPFPLKDLLEKVRAVTSAAPPPPPPLAPPATPAGSTRPAEAVDTGIFPTRPISAAAHTTSTTAISKRSATTLPAMPPVAGAPPAAPASPPPVPAPSAAAPSPAADAEAQRRELRPQGEPGGFGRYTRVDLRGRTLVVLTEASARPRFTVTTVITERGAALRKVETVLPYPLAREDDEGIVHQQIDLQHDDALQRLEQLALSPAPRRILWTDQNRNVDPALLAWALSALAQQAETEAGTEEAERALRATHERLALSEDLLRAFDVTANARVVVAPGYHGRMPRRAVSAVAAWSAAFAAEAMQVPEASVLEPIRQATGRRGLELERLGFYARLRRRAT